MNNNHGNPAETVVLMFPIGSQADHTAFSAWVNFQLPVPTAGIFRTGDKQENLSWKSLTY